MPPFKPMLTEVDLPVAGTSRESISFDMKAEYKSGKGERQEEMAKDIAAFANASGGTILVGALSDGSEGPFRSFKPMPKDSAELLAREFGEVTKQRCSPSPFVDPRVIEAAGGFVVAINVWPFPGAVVGARRGTRDERDGSPFVFPMRVGTVTRWLEVEQLPMLMIPDLRRAAILLDSIPLDQRTRARIYMVGGNPQEWNIKTVDVLANVVELTSPFRTGNLEIGSVCRVPLDSVRSVWRCKETQWAILLSGGMLPKPDGWIFHPTIAGSTTGVGA